jgi:hypothetical protein
MFERTEVNGCFVQVAALVHCLTQPCPGATLHSHSGSQYSVVLAHSMFACSPFESGSSMKIAMPAVRGALPPLWPARLQRPRIRSCRPVVRGLQVPHEPGYDDLKLDDAFYKELGIDEEEREAQKTYEPDDIGAA